MAKERRKKVFAVFGLGIFGRQLCETLVSRGASVIAVDNQEHLVEQIKETVMQAVLLDSADENSMSQLPLEDVDEAVVTMGDSVEASILTTALLKKLAVPRVIARAISPVHEQVLRQIGAEEVLNLEIEAGTRLAGRLVAPQVLERVAISRDISVAELHVPRAVTGVPLSKLDLRGKHRINVIAITKISRDVDETGNPVETKEVIFPGPEDVLEDTDVVHVVGSNDAIETFGKL